MQRKMQNCSCHVPRATYSMSKTMDDSMKITYKNILHFY